MGLTAEAVAQQFKVSREDQDEFLTIPYEGLKAQAEGKFDKQIVPITVSISSTKTVKKKRNLMW
jgi:acetyl-CoA acyltransferase